MNDNNVYLSSFPASLAVDPSKYALARAIADELRELNDRCDRLRIYSRIDELPEQLLDILAFDFAVSWYYYNGTLETKRAQIKSCFYVHKHLGTRGALETALSDVCPGTVLEEWFEYGGEPYYFRVILDISEQRLPIYQNDIEKKIEIFKSLRSVLEANSIIYRSRAYAEGTCKLDWHIATAPTASRAMQSRAGLYPGGDHNETE